MAESNVVRRRRRQRSAIEYLTEAIRNNDYQMLQQLIDSGASVNAVDPGSGRPILHYAVTLGNPLCVEVLLKSSDIDVNKVSRVDKTALDCAIYASRYPLEIARLLLDSGAKCVRSDDRKLSSFHRACKAGATEISELIFNARQDELVIDNKWRLLDGKTPHYYAPVEDVGVLKLLFAIDKQCDIEVDFDNDKILSMTAQAAHAGDTELLKMCLERFGVDILNTDPCYIFHNTMYTNSSETLRLLLDHGCSPFDQTVEEKNFSTYDYRFKMQLLCDLILFIPIESGLVEMFISLIPPAFVSKFETWYLREFTLKVDTSDWSYYFRHPLYAAIVKMRSVRSSVGSILRSLLNRGFDPKLRRHSFSSRPCTGDDYLGYRVDDNYLRYISMLNGFRDRYYNIIGHAILMIEFADDLKELVGVFVQCGVNVNATSHTEFPPLIVLALAGNSELTSEIASMLIYLGADLNYRRVNSSFLCSDLAVAAALTGNTALLNLIVTKVGLNVSDLLSDLAVIERNPETDETAPIPNCYLDLVTNLADQLQLNSPFQTYLNRNGDLDQLGNAQSLAVRLYSRMRRYVGDSVHALLRFEIKTKSFYNLCRKVDCHFAVDLGTEELDDVSWTSLYIMFENVDHLKHMCRVKILKRLLLSSQGAPDNQSKIEMLPVPESMKDYLSYSDKNNAK